MYGVRPSLSLSVLPGGEDVLADRRGGLDVRRHRRQVVGLDLHVGGLGVGDEVDVGGRHVGVLRLRGDRPRQALAAERDRLAARLAARHQEEAELVAQRAERVVGDPRAGDRERALALGERLPGGVVAGAVEVRREVALVGPLLRASSPPRRFSGVSKLAPSLANTKSRVASLLGERVLDGLELVDAAELVEVAERDRDLAVGLRLGEHVLELAERLGHGGDLVLVVEDADDLALLRDAVEVAGAELLAVGGEAVEVEQRLRPAVVPAVGVGVGVHRLEQAALDERAHDLAALVGLARCRAPWGSETASLSVVLRSVNDFATRLIFTFGYLRQERPR